MKREVPPNLEIPMQEGLFVIFGITGDLVKRKLLPALYQLVEMDILPQNFRILGTTRRNTQTGDIISNIRETLDSNGEPVDEKVLDKLSNLIEMVHMNIDQKEDYNILKEALEKCDKQFGKTVNRLYYLAVPPNLFEHIINNLKAVNLHESPENSSYESRLLIEKPFGSNYQTAVELIDSMSKVFDEESIYRVDHYLAKETAQNILTFRFNNPLFKAAWDNRSISHVIITASEALGIENRISFYEQTGALRDLIQSHLLQLLALTTMEEPHNLSAGAIHKAKLDLLKCIDPIKPNQVSKNSIRGQYSSYRAEVDNSASNVETYAALRLNISNERWSGVPILMRTGKALHEKITEITVVFKDIDSISDDLSALTIRIQPNEGIVLNLLVKKPSLYLEKEMVQMKFFYNQAFNHKQPDAYARVLVDAIRGDKTLFTTHEEVLESWKIIENVLESWERNEQPLEVYENGTWGPDLADKMASDVGADWMTTYNPNHN